DQPTRKKGSPEDGGEIEITGPRRLPAAARSLCASDDSYAKEAELGSEEGCKSASHERVGSDRLYSGRGAQLTGALDRHGSRWPGKRSAWGSVSYRSWNA